MSFDFLAARKCFRTAAEGEGDTLQQLTATVIIIIIIMIITIMMITTTAATRKRHTLITC